MTEHNLPHSNLEDDGITADSVSLEPAASRDHRGEKAEIESKIASQEARKLKARNEKHRAIWFGFGMFGLIGWAVVVPALAGVALGLWIDARWPSRFSWALMLLIAGLALGCWNAWNWMHREGRIDE